MNILLDLIILAIAGVTIFLAAKRGFIKTAVSAGSSVIALIVVICFTGALAGALESTPLADAVHNGTESFVEGLLDSDTDSKTLALDEDGRLYSVLDAVGVDTDEFADWAQSNLDDAEASFRKQLVDYIATPVTSLIMRALAMLILYLGAAIVLKLCAGLLTAVVEKLPFIRQANTLLGIVLGIVIALVRVFIFCAIAGILINTAAMTNLPLVSSIDPGKTYLFRLFDAIQILKFLF